jgi:Rieske 2Fe-2S family protein
MATAPYRETLPASWFYDPVHYGREVRAIWQRDWICVGREEDWPQSGDFQRLRIGGQQIVVTRAEDGALHAWHNTCRHRGSVLCETDTGRFEQGRIVCPYHAWTYALSGELLRAPRSTQRDGLRLEDFPLYRVALANWRGFVFVNLAEEPAISFEAFLAGEAERVAAWPLEDLRRVHRDRQRLACNWKVFWENFLECYHCPGVHPELVRLVPLYRTGFMEYADAGLEPDPARPSAMLRPGAVTWSSDGSAALPWFEGLGTADAERGMTFATLPPTMFLVAHVDYVRSVRVLPLGPEETELTVDWYVHRDRVDHPALDVGQLTAFASQVVAEDARACELNQAGLRCGRHAGGVLLEVEDYVYDFEQWVRGRLEDGGR